MSRRTQRQKARQPAPQAKPEVVATPPATVQVIEPAQQVASDKLAEALLKKRRTFSIKGLADFLQVDRSVIDKDINKNLFVPDRMGGKGTGNEYEIDVAKYFAWKVDHVRRQALAEAGVEGSDDKPSDRLAMLKLAQQAGLVAFVEDFEDLMSRANSELKQTLMSLSVIVGRSMAGFPPDKVRAWRKQTDNHVRNALEAYANSDAAKLKAIQFHVIEDMPEEAAAFE